MTNEEIIFVNSIELMKNGVIKGTGKFLTRKLSDGTEIQIEQPEEIHTFNGWKERGFSVKKGEHAKAKFDIYKCRVSSEKIPIKDENGEPEEKSFDVKHMFRKTAFWFTAEQVEPIKA